MIEAESRQAEPVRSTPAAKAGRRARFNRSMRLVRRAHLYAGLFMVPWVFLYGVTAFLFNHPDALPDRPSIRIGAAEWSGTALGGLPKPEALAAEVAASLKTPGYRLVRPDEAEFTRELAATARSGGKPYNIRIDLASGEGSAREVAERPRVKPAPFASPKPDASAKRPPLADLAEILPAVLARVGLPAEGVTVRTAPELGFLVEGDGKTWRVQYDLATGAISGRPEDAPGEPLSSRRFLTRLHLAHGYPSSFGARWGWAVAVDLMALSMVGWGATGLVMWWQMTSVRRVGLVVLALSAAVAATLAVGMHESLTSAAQNGRAEAPAPEKTGGRRQAKPESPAAEGRPSPSPSPSPSSSP